MFCPHCGNQMEDDSLFCAACGNSVEAGAGAGATPSAEPQPEYTGDFALGRNASSPFATPEFDAPRPEKPKKPKKEKKKLSKKTIIGMVSGFVAAALVATLLIVNWSWIRGWWVLTTGSDEEYFEFVEEQQAKSYAQAISAAYSAPMNLFEMDSSGTSTITFKADEEVIREFLNMASGGNFRGDLSFLNEMQLDTAYNITEDGMSSSVGLVISGQTILTANMTVSYEDEKIYISVPELSDKVLTMDLHVSDMTDGQDLQDVIGMLGEMEEILPDEKEMTKLLEKYIGAALGAADDVTVKSSTLTVGGISQECRKITVNISEKTMYEAAIAVLKEAKNDKDLKSLFQKVAGSDLMEEFGGYKTSTSSEISEAYRMLQEEIDDLIEELQDEKKRMAERYEDAEIDYFTEPRIILIDYVNSSHEVIGRELRVREDVDDDDGKTVFFYATAEHGKDVGTRIELARAYFGMGILLEGTGTQSGDKVTGEYTLTVEKRSYGYEEYYNEEYGYNEYNWVERIEEHEICTLKLTDFDTKSLKEGKLNGKVRVIPSADLTEDLLGSRLASMLDLSVEFDFRSSGNKVNMDINLLMGDSLMLGVSADTTTDKGKELTAPSGSKLNADKPSERTEFVNSLDFSKIRNALRKTDLPSDILSYAERFLDQLEREMSYGYSYGYEYEYGYGY